MKNISYLGPVSSFGYQASQQLFGPGGNYVACKSHEEIFVSVLNGKSEYGVMAYENVDAGVVFETVRTINRALYFDPDCQVRIVNEYSLPIELHLMGRSEASLPNAKYIVSHNMALLQSNIDVEWVLNAHPHLKVLKSNSTSEAAKMASEESSVIALSSERSKYEFDLDFIQKNLENKQNNMTRFIVVSKGGAYEQTGLDKSCIGIYLDREVPGSLSMALNYFEKEGINISIPYPVPHPIKNYEYIYVVELEQHLHSLGMQRALKRLLETSGIYYQVYGTYPNRSTVFCEGFVEPVFANG